MKFLNSKTIENLGRLNLKTATISLVLAFIISNCMWHFTKPDNVLGYPVASVVVLQTLLIFLAFLYGLMVSQLRAEKRQGTEPSKQIELYKVTLQFTLSLLAGTIVIYPLLGFFFLELSIVLVAVGTILYGKTKDRLYRTMILWGILLLVLRTLMAVLAYGIDSLV